MVVGGDKIVIKAIDPASLASALQTETLAAARDRIQLLESGLVWGGGGGGGLGVGGGGGGGGGW